MNKRLVCKCARACVCMCEHVCVFCLLTPLLSKLCVSQEGTSLIASNQQMNNFGQWCVAFVNHTETSPHTPFHLPAEEESACIIKK